MGEAVCAQKSEGELRCADLGSYLLVLPWTIDRCSEACMRICLYAHYARIIGASVESFLPFFFFFFLRLAGIRLYIIKQGAPGPGGLADDQSKSEIGRGERPFVGN